MLSLRAAEPANAMQVAGVHVRSWQRGSRGLLPDHHLDGRLGIPRRLILEAGRRLTEQGFTEAILWVLAGTSEQVASTGELCAEALVSTPAVPAGLVPTRSGHRHQDG